MFQYNKLIVTYYILVSNVCSFPTSNYSEPKFLENVIKANKLNCTTFECVLSRCELFNNNSMYWKCVQMSTSKLKNLEIKIHTFGSTMNIDDSSINKNLTTRSDNKVSTKPPSKEDPLKLDLMLFTWKHYVYGFTSVIFLSIKLWVCIKYRSCIHSKFCSKLCCKRCKCCRKNKPKYATILHHDVEMNTIYS